MSKSISARTPRQNRVRHGSLAVDILINACMIVLGLLTVYPV